MEKCIIEAIVQFIQYDYNYKSYIVESLQNGLVVTKSYSSGPRMSEGGSGVEAKPNRRVGNTFEDLEIPHISLLSRSSSESIDLESVSYKNNDEDETKPPRTFKSPQSKRKIKKNQLSQSSSTLKIRATKSKSNDPTTAAKTARLLGIEPTSPLSRKGSKKHPTKIDEGDNEPSGSVSKLERIMGSDMDGSSLKTRSRNLGRKKKQKSTRVRTNSDLRASTGLIEASEYFREIPSCLEPILDHEGKLVRSAHVTFCRDNFIRQSVQSSASSTLNHSNEVLLQTSPKNGSPSFTVGMGTMQLQYDRWWKDTPFSGEALLYGYLYHDHIDTIEEYIPLLGEEKKSQDRLAWQFAFKISKDVQNSLETMKPIQVFSGNKSVRVSAGLTSFGIVSNLGEFHIRSTTSHYPVCLGTTTKPIDWEGYIIMEKILGRRVRELECGDFHCAVITDTDEVIMWGNNTPLNRNVPSGQVGHISNELSPPAIITDIPGKPLFIRCGRTHTVIGTTKGVFACGVNKLGQLGNSSVDENIIVPVLGIDGLASVSSISCGSDHTLMCTEDGSVFSWGANHNGQLGHSQRFLFVKEAKKIPDITNAIDVACGKSHSVILTKDGRVYTVGSNFFGELGITSTENSSALTKVKLEHIIVKIVAGPHNTCALTDTGLVYQWGFLRGPKLTCHQYTPRLIEQLEEDRKFIVAFDTGATHSVFIEEATLSEFLWTLTESCRTNTNYNGSPLLKRLVELPYLDHSLHFLQKRVTNGLQKGGSAVVYLSEYYVTERFKESHTSACFLFTITNPNDYSVIVKLATIAQENTNQDVITENECFRLPKRSSEQIKILVVFSKPITRKAHSLLHITSAKKEKHAPIVHCFGICASLPKKKPGSFLAQEKEDLSLGSSQLVNMLGTYVPMVLLQHFVEQPNPPSEPNIQQFPAAILFLDISGFTSLNERLAQLGPAGPELVSKHINSYFASLIKAVSEHGGDVLKFAGDALICMWAESPGQAILPVDGDMDSLTRLTLRAIQCGFYIQECLAEYDSNEGFSLTLHIGIGSGELLSLWVGSQGSYEYLVSGEPLAQLRTAVDNSKTGEVVISAESWQLVEAYCEGEPRDNDYYVSSIVKRVPVTSNKTLKGWPRVDAESALRCFIPAAVQTSIDSQQLQGWGNELRVATILFVKLNTDLPNHSKEVYLASINEVLCCMQKAIFKYEGMVRQFLADDKGTVLIAAFGLPPFCHVDDPLRGIRAALEIHETLQAIKMDCSIGITMGQVYCGSVGCPVRQEYAMVGDVVNLSARLMVAAFKQKLHILCDEPSYKAAEELIAFSVQEPIFVKGKKNAIAIFQPTGLKEYGQKRYQFSHKNLVGREMAKAKIKNAVDVLLDSKVWTKGSICIGGGSGIGKSLLCQYALYIAKRKNISVCHGVGDRFQTSEPLFPWRSIISDLYEITSVYSRTGNLTKKTKQAIVQISSEITEEWHQSLPLLNDIFERKVIKENHYTKSLPKEHRAQYLLHLLLHILQEKSNENPFMIVFDDIHYADHLSLSLLNKVVMECPFILTLASMTLLRTKPPIMDTMMKSSLLEYFQIFPLSQSNTNTLMMKIMEVDSIPKSISDFCKTSLGNPRFIREIASDLLQSDMLTIADRKCIVTGNLRDLKLKSVTIAINEKLDRLPRSQQMVLKVASVIGYSFELHTLLQVYPFENKKFIKGELEALCFSGLIRASDKQDCYLFVNQHFLKAAYTRLTFEQRITLHQEVVGWYNSQPDQVERVMKLGYHLSVIIKNKKDVKTEYRLQAISYLENAGATHALIYGPEISRIWRVAALEIVDGLPDDYSEKKEMRDRLLMKIPPDEEDQPEISLWELSGAAGPCQLLEQDTY